MVTVSKILISLLLLSGLNQQNDQEILEQGLKLEAEGNYEQALEVWASATNLLEIPSLAIGQEYIRLATEQELREHYQTASSMYYWGLTAETTEPNFQALEQELAMLEPLMTFNGLDNTQYKQMKKFLENSDPVLYRHLQLFWEQLDPTPATRYNERLIEHWERIAYAREHFDRQDNPPYETDDRGITYVQYGPPDKQQDGVLLVTRGEIMLVSNTLDENADAQLMANVLLSEGVEPYYDVWVYNRPNPEMKYNLVFIFADDKSGSFGKMQTVEEMIPNNLFSFDSSRFDVSGWQGKTVAGVNLTPGMVLQWIFYEKLAFIDAFFADQFSSMTHDWEKKGSTNPYTGQNTVTNKSTGRVQMQRSKSAALKNLKAAPPEQSTYKKVFPEIPLQAWHYRMLDEEGGPVTTTFMESQPGQSFLSDLTANQDVLFPEDSEPSAGVLSHYELTHGIRTSDSDGELLSQSRQSADLILDLQESPPSSSVFKIPVTEENQQISLYAELHNRHPESAPPVEETPFPASLRALGKLQMTLPEPLNTDPGSLQMSDLLLGYQMQEESSENVLFPFVVANDRKIPEGEELAVHFEVYHLQPGQDGIAEFTVEYEIYQKRRMQWLRGRDTEVSLSFNQQVQGSRHVQNLSILTRDLEPDTYTFRFEVSDQQSGQSTLQELKFEIIERGEQEISMKDEN